jgi:ubiquinone/menaquinone biosynthesis C-methylase UbiE
MPKQEMRNESNLIIMISRFKDLRRKIFSRNYTPNEILINIIKDYPSHFFLKNPSGHIIFLYLVEYVIHFSEFWFKIKKNKLKILDWGCGKGQVSFLLKQHCHNIYSCDRNNSSQDSAFDQKVPIINYLNLKVVELQHDYLLPYDDQNFDVVVSFGVLEHVANDYASLKEINRILKMKGLFFCFNLPYILSYTQRISHLLGNYYHTKLYSKKIISNLLLKTNFSLIDIWHRQFFPKNRMRYFKYNLFEKIDQFLVDRTILKYFATNIEFVAYKK